MIQQLGIWQTVHFKTSDLADDEEVVLHCEAAAVLWEERLDHLSHNQPFCRLQINFFFFLIFSILALRVCVSEYCV